MALDQNINRIKFLRSTVAGRKPALADLQDGELALNLADRTIYTRNGNNIIDMGFGLGGNVDGNIDASGIISADNYMSSKKFTAQNPTNVEATVSLDWYNDKPRLRVGGMGNGSIADFEIAGASEFVRMRLSSAGHMTIPGNSTAAGFIGNGSQLTNLNASMLATGTVPTARLSGTYSINSATATTLQNIRKIFGNDFNGSADVFGVISETSRITIDQSSYPALQLKPTGTAGTLGTIFEAGPSGWPYVAIRPKETLASSTGQVAHFGFPSNKTGAHTIAMTSDNVASATKLETARTINGIAFDGTQNIVVEDDTKLYKANKTVNGGSTNDNQTVYRDIASMSPGWSIQGASIVIHLPKAKNKSNTMMQIKVKGGFYTSGRGNWEFSIYGYNHTTGWINVYASIANGMNDVNFNSVQFGRTTDHEVMILKITSGSGLSYPSVDITEMICSHEGVDNWNTADFLITAETDLSKYTIEKEVYVGPINTKSTKGYSTIPLLTADEMKKSSPIYIPEHRIHPDAGTGISYAPWMTTAHTSNSGYRVNCGIGSYRGSDDFSKNGVFIGVGQTDTHMSESYKFLTQGRIEHSLSNITFGHNIAVEGSVKVSSIQNDTATGFMSILNGSGAQGISVGRLLVSNSYNDTSKVPTNGAYIKGQLVVADTISIESNGSNFQKLIQVSNAADGGYLAVGNTGSDKGFVELGTIDDVDTKIYVRKRNSSNAVLATTILMDELHDAWFVNRTMSVNGFGVGSTSQTAGYGVGLYGSNCGSATTLPSYGMAFAGTATYGAHGSVAGNDWATYFTMTGAQNRGWIFKSGDTGTGGNVASISAWGHASFNGNVSAGGDVYTGTGLLSSASYHYIDMGRNGSDRQIFGSYAGKYYFRRTYNNSDGVVFNNGNITATGNVTAPRFIGTANVADRLTTTTGNPPVYGVRAWGTFTSPSPTSPSILEAGNIASIEWIVNRIYKITFVTPMPHANYSVSLTGQHTPSGSTQTPVPALGLARNFPQTTTDFHVSMTPSDGEFTKLFVQVVC